MLFTLTERIAAEDLRATDRVLDAFWKLIEDPRTDVIDLSLKSVQEAVEYTLAAVGAADVAERKASILSGVLQ
jgi:hypothetical protein